MDDKQNAEGTAAPSKVAAVLSTLLVVGAAAVIAKALWPVEVNSGPPHGVWDIVLQNAPMIFLARCVVGVGGLALICVLYWIARSGIERTRQRQWLSSLVGGIGASDAALREHEDLVRLRDEVVELRQEAEDTTGDLHALDDELREAAQTITSMHSDLDTAIADRDYARSELDRARQELDRLRGASDAKVVPAPESGLTVEP